MSINEFVEMTNFLCLICFSIYDKMQSFIDESGLLIFLLLLLYFFFCVFYAEIQDGRQKWWENNFCKKSPVDSADTLAGEKFRRNRSISLSFRDKLAFAFNAEIQDGRQKW